MLRLAVAVAATAVVARTAAAAADTRIAVASINVYPTSYRRRSSEATRRVLENHARYCTWHGYAHEVLESADPELLFGAAASGADELRRHHHAAWLKSVCPRLLLLLRAPPPLDAPT